MSPRATSTRFLNPSRDGDSPTALGSLGQGLTTLQVKKFFLTPTLRSNLRTVLAHRDKPTQPFPLSRPAVALQEPPPAKPGWMLGAHPTGPQVLAEANPASPKASANPDGTKRQPGRAILAVGHKDGGKFRLQTPVLEC